MNNTQVNASRVVAAHASVKNEASVDGIDFLVPSAALDKLQASATMKEALRDKRLQEVLANIDAAPDRASALNAAIQREGGRFQTFLDEMLLTIGAAERVEGQRSILFTMRK